MAIRGVHGPVAVLAKQSSVAYIGRTPFNTWASCTYGQQPINISRTLQIRWLVRPYLCRLPTTVSVQQNVVHDRLILIPHAISSAVFCIQSVRLNHTA